MYEIYTSRDGKIVELSPSQVSRVKKSIVWVRCVNPSREEISWLSKITKAPEEEFHETIEEEERPKLVMRKYLEIIFSAPHREHDEDITTVPLYFYIHNNIVLTIEKRVVTSIAALVSQVRQNKRKFLFRRSVGHFIFYVLDQVQDEYLHMIQFITRRVDFFEEKGVFTRKNMDLMYDASVALAYFNQALLANIEVLNAMRKCFYKSITDKDRDHFTELYYDALQLRDTERIQREAITNLFDLQALINTQRLNKLMKRLTSLALIIMVPTFVTGVYGMNLKYLPFADHPLGFWILMGIMAFMSLVMLGFFFWLDWL